MFCRVCASGPPSSPRRTKAPHCLFRLCSKILTLAPISKKPWNLPSVTCSDPKLRTITACRGITYTVLCRQQQVLQTFLFFRLQPPYVEYSKISLCLQQSHTVQISQDFPPSFSFTDFVSCSNAGLLWQDEGAEYPACCRAWWEKRGLS